MERYLQELPDVDYQILRHHKAGARHCDIAALMDMSIEVVRSSLIRTYADLRIKMIGGDEAEPLQKSAAD